MNTEQNLDAIARFKEIEWLDFQIKPLLNNELKENANSCNAICRTRELLIAPDGMFYKCHRDLYKQENGLGYLHEINAVNYEFRKCTKANECHPCDLNIKRDRYGKDGYCSIDRKLV